MIKTLLMILALAIAGYAQTFVGSTKTHLYYIEGVSPTEMVGTIISYSLVNDEVKLDGNYLMTRFNVNCDKFEYNALEYKGVQSGKEIKGIYKSNPLIAEKPQMIFSALQKFCKDNL